MEANKIPKTRDNVLHIDVGSGFECTRANCNMEVVAYNQQIKFTRKALG